MMLTRMRKYVSEFIFLIADIRTILVRSPDSIPSGNGPKPGPLGLGGCREDHMPCSSQRGI